MFAWMLMLPARSTYIQSQTRIRDELKTADLGARVQASAQSLHGMKMVSVSR